VILLFGVVRAVHFASLMSIFGASVYLALLRTRLGMDLQTPASRILFASAAALALLTGVIWLCLVAGQMSGDWTKTFDLMAIETDVRSTRFGQIFLIRLAGLTALSIVCIRKGSSHSMVVAPLAGLLLVALSLTSHAAASSNDDLLILFHSGGDAVHLLAGGFWLGSLCVLATLTGRFRHEGDILLGPLRLFSVWGTYAVAALVVTGTINALYIVPLSVASLGGAYVGVLATKVVLASAMIVLAGLNRWRVAPGIRDRESNATPNLVRNISAEIALGFTVIGIAGTLGLMPP
jgi:putative copper resistance protein D